MKTMYDFLGSVRKYRAGGMSDDFVARQVEVMAGWDRPMGEFFMTVFDLAPVNEDEEVLWSAMYNPKAEDRMGTTRLRAKLTEMGIVAPAGFWEKVEKREGNVQHQFGGVS